MGKMINDEKQEHVVGVVIVVVGLIQNILSQERIRLYWLEEFWRDKPLPLLFPW